MNAPKLSVTRGMQMRIWIGIALVVAIGLIWSLAVMSEWVPVNSAEMKSAAVSPEVITVRQGSASAE